MRNFVSYILVALFVVLLLAVISPLAGLGFGVAARPSVQGQGWRPKSLIAPANRIDWRSRKRAAVG